MLTTAMVIIGTFITFISILALTTAIIIFLVTSPYVKYYFSPSAETWRAVMKNVSNERTPSEWAVAADHPMKGEEHNDILVEAAIRPAELAGYLSYIQKTHAGDDGEYLARFFLKHKEKIIPVLPLTDGGNQVCGLSSSLSYMSLTFGLIMSNIKTPSSTQREFYNTYYESMEDLHRRAQRRWIRYQPDFDTVPGVLSRMGEHGISMSRLGESFEERMLEHWDATYPESAALPNEWKIRTLMIEADLPPNQEVA